MPKFLAISHDTETGEQFFDNIIAPDPESADHLISRLRPGIAVPSIIDAEELRNMAAALDAATPETILAQCKITFAGPQHCPDCDEYFPLEDCPDAEDLPQGNLANTKQCPNCGAPVHPLTFTEAIRPA